MKPPRHLSRRAFASGALALAALPARAGSSNAPFAVRVRDDLASFPISPEIYGSNEVGAMDGGALSATLDARAGVAARRLGGNLMTNYNWVNNASNAGKDYHNSNGAFWLEALKIPRELWSHPAIVIETMHEASLAMGASSLVTLPVQGFVAADLAGEVAEKDAAPSSRFVAVKWRSDARASDSPDPGVCDMPHLLARLIEKYGPASSPRGIRAYALDNEPGLWSQNHPRTQRKPATIRNLLDNSIAAARAIKSIDPSAKVFGPASWGATEMVNFQSAPDWADFASHGCFLAAYLAAFRQASERDGRRLLDALDVHWYAFSRQGDIFRSEKTELDGAKRDAPRSLDEPGFREDSWVSRALAKGGGVGLPILPSLTNLASSVFPGTDVAVTEFNYGGAGSLASGLALADALGRMGRNGVAFAAHWGALSGWLGEAYRLYRAPDSTGARFGDSGLRVDIAGGPDISVFASRDVGAAKTIVVVINKSQAAVAVDIVFARPGQTLAAAFGFDAERPIAVETPTAPTLVEEAARVQLPARSARRFAFA